ncbi:MAG: TrkA family potassium uptake protein [Cellulosilyticaceae bacterium]
MRIVIAGAGKVGYYLTKLLNEEKHIVSTIEKEEALCERLAREVDSLVICGNATKTKDLEDAGIEEADVIIAATGKDEENLLICQMAKINFKVPKAITRINNPKNEAIFKQLGIEHTVSSTTVIAHLIEEEAIISGLKTLLTIEEGDVSLTECVVESNSEVSGCKIKNLVLPEECNIAYILRQRKVVIPRGDVVLQNGDRIIAVVTCKQKRALEKLFTQKTKLMRFFGGGGYEEKTI